MERLKGKAFYKLYGSYTCHPGGMRGPVKSHGDQKGCCDCASVETIVRDSAVTGKRGPGSGYTAEIALLFVSFFQRQQEFQSLPGLAWPATKEVHC